MTLATFINVCNAANLEARYSTPNPAGGWYASKPLAELMTLVIEELGEEMTEEEYDDTMLDALETSVVLACRGGAAFGGWTQHGYFLGARPVGTAQALQKTLHG